MFVNCLLPRLFSTIDEQSHEEICEALGKQLYDKHNRNRILNEGAARRIRDTCMHASQELERSVWAKYGDQNFLREISWRDLSVRFYEFRLVCDLLCWLAEDIHKPFHTNSVLVCRVAASLKAIGFPINQIDAWSINMDNVEESGRKSVFYSAGGLNSQLSQSSGSNTIIQEPYIHHYRMDTVGAMIHAAFSGYGSEEPVTFQLFFTDSKGYLEGHLSVEYFLGPRVTGEQTGNQNKRAAPEMANSFGHKILVEKKDGSHIIQTRFEWKEDKQTKTTPRALRLAEIYFPLSSTHIAPLYEQVADADMLKASAKWQPNTATSSLPDRHLIRFRALTAAIILALTARLTTNFCDPQLIHATTMDLQHNAWLSAPAAMLDKAASSSITFQQATALVATVHAAIKPRIALAYNEAPIIGWRFRDYAVLPSLFTAQHLTESAPHLDVARPACLDTFIGNLEHHPDGSIRSAATTYTQQPRVPFVQPDTATALTLEPPSDPPGSRDLGIAVRICGKLAGCMSVVDVLHYVMRGGGNMWVMGMTKEAMEAYMRETGVVVEVGNGDGAGNEAQVEDDKMDLD
ncbi:hypothetical protein MMC19_000862 [Ptychographa xylographoides]|nr:hypothetical protein [Ptychographa xylographoides]